MKHNIYLSLLLFVLVCSKSWAQDAEAIVVFEQVFEAQQDLQNFKFEFRNETEAGSSEYELVKKKDPHTGRWDEKPKPPGFDDWWNGKKTCP